MAKSEGDLQCVGRLEVVRPKPVGFLCGSIPIATDNSFHAFNSSALVPSQSPQTYILNLSLSHSFLISFLLISFLITEWVLRGIGCFRRRPIWIRLRFFPIFQTRFFPLALCTPSLLEEARTICFTTFFLFHFCAFRFHSVLWVWDITALVL